MATPQIGVETSGQFTTLTEEAALLQQMHTETDATLSTMGQSVNNRPIYRLDIGTDINGTLMVVGLQHGDEPGGREGVLAFLRDVAYSQDPEIMGYLAEHRIVGLPTLNPDSLLRRRNNANNVNINRDHFTLTQPETIALVKTIRETQPLIILDAHEYPWTGNNWLGRGNGLPGTHPKIQALGDLIYDAADELITEHEFQAYPYWDSVSGRPMLSMAAGAHHAASLLSESNRNDTNTVRTEVTRLAIEATRTFHAAHAHQLRAAQIASIEWARFSDGPDTFIIREEYLHEESPETVRLAGYEAQEPIPARFVEHFGVFFDAEGLAPMKQDARLILPQIMDPAAMDVSVSAYRAAFNWPPFPTSQRRLKAMHVGRGGVPRPVIEIRHQVDGQARQVQLPE